MQAINHFIEKILKKLLYHGGATESRITQEMLSRQYQQFIMNITGASTVTLLFMIFVEGAYLSLTAWLWACFQWALEAIHFFDRRRFLRTKPEQRDYLSAYKNSLIIIFISGILWGLTPYVFLGTNPEQFPLILTATIAMLLSGGLALIYLPSGYIIFSLASMPIAAYAIFYLMEWSLLSVMIVFYMSMMVQFSLNSNRSAASTIAMSFKNEDLAKKLHLANIAKSKFLATASHDLRQPLQALNFLNASALAAGQADSRLLQNMQRNINSLNLLFDTLLDISKLDAGITSFKTEIINVQELIDTLVNSFNDAADRKGVILSCNTAKGLYIKSDAPSCHRILMNLISNAIRYTEKGNININTQDTIYQNKPSIKISIIDTGVGIAEKHIDSIFDEFYQVNTDPGEQSGLGLGLSIVKRLSILLGHKIEVDSKEGEGTVFSVYFDKSSPLYKEKDPINKSENITIDSKKKILIIDDNNEIVNALQHLLEKWGYKVLPAKNLNQVKAYPISELSEVSAIISDYNFGEKINGINLIEWFHQEVSPAPAILITGTTSSEFMKKTAASNVNYSTLHKPILPAKLKLLLESYLKEDQ